MSYKRKILFTLYSFSFGIWIFTSTLGSSFAWDFFKLSALATINKLLVIGFACFFILTKKNTFKNWISIFIILCLLVIGFLNSGYFDAIFIFLIFISLDESNYLDIVRTCFFGILFGIAFVLLLYFLNYIPDKVQIRLGNIRHSFGFLIPIMLPGITYSGSICFLLLKKDKVDIKKILIIVLANLLPFIYCDGRTYFIQIVLLSICFISEIVCKKLGFKTVKFWYFLALLALISGLLFSLYFAMNYSASNLTMSKINALMTGRLSWWKLYWDTYEVFPFGQEILRINASEASSGGFLNSSMMILDNTYISLLLENGWIIFLIFMICLVKLLKVLMIRNDTISLILWLSWITTFMSGNNALFLNRNILLLQFCFLLLHLKEVEHSKYRKIQLEEN